MNRRFSLIIVLQFLPPLGLRSIGVARQALRHGSSPSVLFMLRILLLLLVLVPVDVIMGVTVRFGTVGIACGFLR